MTKRQTDRQTEKRKGKTRKTQQENQNECKQSHENVVVMFLWRQWTQNRKQKYSSKYSAQIWRNEAKLLQLL